MRRHLVAAVALAPLCLAAGAVSAQTTDTVTGSLTAPIATATAVDGGPADIDITTGSVTVSGTTPAVTLNSSNTILNSGAITITDVNGSTDVLANGGYTGAITNTGSITNTESFSATTNSDGFAEEPFVSSTSAGRYGIRLIGTSALDGSIVNSGTITVRGNTSYAVSLEAPLTGSFANSGTILLTGDNGVAVRSIPGATIGGTAEFTGAVTTLGQNTSAVNLQGDVTGAVSVYSTISSTGYANTTRPSTTSQLTNIQATPTQIEQSAGAVIIGGNVGGGVFIGAPPIGTTTTTTADLDGDGIEDGVEGSGTIVNYGSAPALLVGASGTGAGGQNATVIGEFGTTDGEAAPQPANAFGLIIRGEVSGLGVYDGVTATGLQLGTGLTGTSTTIDGGVRVVGNVTADSYEADATAIHLYSGLSTPALRNDDFIEASVNHSILVSTSTATSTATGVLINPGATLSAITNYGTIQATANGDHMSAYGVRDLSGNTTSVLNEGVISAVVTPVTTGVAATTGSQVALDLSANTTGVTLTQMVNPNPIAIEVTTTTSTSGVVSTTAALTTATASTTTTTTTTTAGITTTTTTTTPTYPQIVGDVLLGSGTNNVQLLGGSVAGALSLGGGTNDILTLDNGAIFTGALTNVNASTGVAGTGLALTVNNGTLVNTATGTLNLSSLAIGSKGILYAAIDPSNTTNPSTVYNVSGTASLASGAQLGIVLKTPLFNETTYTIVKAGTLADNSGTTSLLSSTIPFVLVGTETSDAATGAITIDLRRRTAAEMQLDPAESSALNAVYASLPNDPAIEAAVLGTYTRSSFLTAYDQLLPDYAGGVFQLSLAASDAVTRATARVNDIENPSGTRGAWTEEVAFGVNRDRDSESAGYQGGGFGFVGGLETGGLGLGAFGLTGAFLTGDIKDPHAPGDNLASFSEGEGGAYWQGQLGGFRGDARVGAGYMLFSERRELLLQNSAGETTLDRQAKGNSTGYSVTGHLGLGYQTGPIGWFYFRPEVHGDYFRLNQGSFTERYGGDGFDLSLANRTGDQTSAEAALVTGMSFGQGFRWRPELELGYRDVFTGSAGDTTAAFANGSSFTLTPPSIRGGGPVGRLDVKADTDFYELNFEAGAEQRADFVEADVRVAVRVLF